MIEDYKKFLKKNRELFYMLFSISTFTVFFLVFISSWMTVIMNVDRSYGNNKRLNTYRENLATFQKCAEKITDATLVETYCGTAPSEPILIW
jgi:hypothetical protein